MAPISPTESMLNTKSLRKCLGLVLVCCWLTTGCTATMLDFDFEGYQSGDVVGEGATDSDAIGEIKKLAGNGVLCTVSAQNALSGQNSLPIEKGTPEPCSGINCLPNVKLVFDPEPSPDPERPVLISWIGKLENAAAETAFQWKISLPGLFFDSILQLDIYRDRLEIFRGPILEDVFNHSFSNEHRVWIRIDPGDETFSVQVSGVGIPSPPTNPPPCVSDSVFCGTFKKNDSAQKPYVMNIEFDEQSILGSIYRIDDVKNTQPRF